MRAFHSKPVPAEYYLRVLVTTYFSFRMELTALKWDIAVTPEAVNIQRDVCINMQWTTKKVETQTGRQDNNAEPHPQTTVNSFVTVLSYSYVINSSKISFVEY